MLPAVLDIATLTAAYRSGRLTPVDVIDEVLLRIKRCADPAIWISRFDDQALRESARRLIAAGGDPDKQPLWGIPFAVKDNIDCAGLDTTAACPAFAYRPQTDAVVVARLKAAGAILIGKTNLDQFATGLNGTRSPYGAPRSVFNSDYISGGSSSGSAVAVAAGQVAFALGTDTAGSGRVPAAFNNIVGIKPTKGLLSTRGLVPACRSLDCISVFALTVGDGDQVRRVAQGFDDGDPYSREAIQRELPGARFRFGVLAPDQREFFGDDEAASLYEAAIERLVALGGEAQVFDYTPFRDTAALLYGGPPVAERLTDVADFFARRRDAIDPAVRNIFDEASKPSAVDAYRASHQLAALGRRTEQEWSKFDLMLLPTAPTIYTVAALRADPITLNSRLGHYTNFVNLLDCCAIAVPGGFRKDGMPLGVTLVAPAFRDDALAALADRLHRAQPFGLGIARDAALPESNRLAPVERDRCVIAVVGAHLSGMALNHELTSLGGKLVRGCRTAPPYRLYLLPNTTPRKPGLVRAPAFCGPGIEVELWSLEPAAFGRFVARIPSPLGIGRIELEDGTQASGFLCEAYAIADAEEITRFGGWRGYVASG